MKVKVKAVIWWAGCPEYVKRYDVRYFPVGSLCTYKDGAFEGVGGIVQLKSSDVKFGASCNEGTILFEEV